MKQSLNGGFLSKVFLRFLISLDDFENFLKTYVYDTRGWVIFIIEA